MRQVLQGLEGEDKFGASVLKAAIQLSLKYLDSELQKMTGSFDIVPVYSMHEMYASLCVLKKQQWVPVAVLARMWAVDDNSAERVALLFSSMSLGKTSVRQNDAGVKEIRLQNP